MPATDRAAAHAGAIRVLVVDGHELIRRGIRHLIAETDDLRVAGEADTMRSALEVASRSRADVAIVDPSLPDGSGPELCRMLGELGVSCLVLTSFIDEDAILAAVEAGADGFLPKAASGTALIRAVRDVAAGISQLDPAATRVLVRHVRDGGRDRRYRHLTSQERLILALLGEGLTNQQIAERTRLAEKTVRNYVSRILAKLGLHHRTEAALYAARHVRPAS
jgi:DNA-binding NarL/FixJ family response regulator